MIEQSSNDAATTLWHRAGGADAVRAEFKALKMTHTTSAPTLFEPWDGVRTTVVDQIRLLRALGSRKAPGATALLRMMESPGKDQAWGVGVGLSNRWGFARKDGWVPVDGGDVWTVSSIGVVSGPLEGVAIAIITTGSRTYPGGRKLVNRIARIVDERLELEPGG
jgi:hypothetical protein